jgi:hypothetical protein
MYILLFTCNHNHTCMNNHNNRRLKFLYLYMVRVLYIYMYEFTLYLPRFYMSCTRMSCSTCTCTTATHVPVPVLTHLLLLYHTTCFTSTLWTRKMPRRPPGPRAADATAVRRGAGRRKAWESRGHFGGRCCLTAGATTDHSPNASRLRHPNR